MQTDWNKLYLMAGNPFECFRFFSSNANIVLKGVIL